MIRPRVHLVIVHFHNNVRNSRKDSFLTQGNNTNVFLGALALGDVPFNNHKGSDLSLLIEHGRTRTIHGHDRAVLVNKFHFGPVLPSFQKDRKLFLKYLLRCRREKFG